MDKELLEHLCVLSRLNAEDADSLIEDMTDIIALMDGIKDAQADYDDRRGGASGFAELREDIPAPSMESEMVTANAVSSEGQFVVPKVVD